MAATQNWKWWHSVILLAIIIAIILISEKRVVNINIRYTWILTLLLLAAFAVIAGQGVTGYWWGIAIDNRNKVSLSRLQMIIWTIIVVAGFLSAALSNINSAAESPLDIAIPEQLLWLMGISTTSLVGSPLIKSTKSKGVIHDNSSPADARLVDMFMAEVAGTETRIDLAKVQMFFVTLVVMIAYSVAMGTELDTATAAGASDGITSLPEIAGGVVGLLGISHAGYLSAKGISGSGTEAPAASTTGSTGGSTDGSET